MIHKEVERKPIALIAEKVIIVQVVVRRRPYVHLDIIVKLELDHQSHVLRGPLARSWDLQTRPDVRLVPRVTTVMLLVYFNHAVRVTLALFVMVVLFRPHPMKSVLMDLMVLVSDVLAKDVLLVVTVRQVHTNLGAVRLVHLLIRKDRLTNPIVHHVLLVHTAPLKIAPNPPISVRLVATVKVPMT